MSTPPLPADYAARRAAYANRKAREGQHLQHQLLDGIRALGWRAIGSYSVRLAGGRWALGLRGDVAGFPDFLLLDPERGRLLARELKLGDHTELSEEQEAWQAALRACGIDAGIWRGSRINDVLEELR